MRRILVCSVLGAIVLSYGAVAGRPVAAADPAAGYDLAKVEEMKGFGGSEAARELLARNGFVVTGQKFKQIFAAYIGGRSWVKARAVTPATSSNPDRREPS